MYHLKIAIRNLRRNGIYSGINIVGLAISLAAFILIMLWVWDELSYDRFHRYADRIYQVNTHVDKMSMEVTPFPLGDAMMQDMPSVENCCRLASVELSFLEYNGQKFYEHKAVDVDTTFFSMFSFSLLKGSVKGLSPDCMVISQSVAKKIFGNLEPVGETVMASNSRLYRVAGVMKDMPANSTIQYSVLLFPDRKNNHNWSDYSYHTYLLLHEGSNISSVGKDITALIEKNAPEMRQVAGFKMILQNIRQLHLYMPDGKDSGMQTVRLFVVIGILILVIAGINYVNLMTARATKRSKDIGLRKVIGASRISLLGQLMQEAVILFLIAIVLALMVAVSVLPVYNTLTAKTFGIVSFLPQIFKICAVTFFVVILLAGLYPAFVLSSFKPAEAFGNKSGHGKNAFFRKALVVVQFVFSAGLIMGTLVMGRQLNYIQTMDPGYGRESVAIIPVQKMDVDNVRGELLELPGIAGISAASEEICRIGTVSDVKWEGRDPNEMFVVNRMDVESHFISTLGLKLVAGSDFTGTEADKDGFIINETAARLMGFDDPIGKQIEFNAIKGDIIGLVNDFHFDDMHRKIGPMVFYCIYPQGRNLMYARIEPGKTQIALDHIEKVWKRYNAGYQYTYKFLDETFEKMHRADLRTGTLFNIFAVIAIVISCLGLFGLVTFTAETKTKEIGIRKVLGASIAGIVEMITKEFLILVFIAMLIAFPLVFWLLNGMLEDFAYRIDITWWMFAAAAVSVVLLTLFTVGFKAIKAATANPIKAIKTE